MTGIHCDARGCQTWASKKMARKSGFLSVRWDGTRLHFCSWDCVMKYAAGKDPQITLGE